MGEAPGANGRREIEGRGRLREPFVCPYVCLWPIPAAPANRGRMTATDPFQPPMWEPAMRATRWSARSRAWRAPTVRIPVLAGSRPQVIRGRMTASEPKQTSITRDRFITQHYISVNSKTNEAKTADR